MNRNIQAEINFEKAFLKSAEDFLKETSEDRVIERISWQGSIESHKKKIEELEQELSIEKFKDYLEWSKNEVAQWPEWKLNMFGGISRRRLPDEPLDY